MCVCVLAKKKILLTDSQIQVGKIELRTLFPFVYLEIFSVDCKLSFEAVDSTVHNYFNDKWNVLDGAIDISIPLHEHQTIVCECDFSNEMSDFFWFFVINVW